MDRRELIITAAGTLVAGAAGGQEKRTLTVEIKPPAATVKGPDGRPVLRYLFGPLPDGEKGPAVPGTCYTHPLYTPLGEVVTDVGPMDHPHHRGVFCAWVEVDGEQKGDWWGWGAKAPKDGRHIRSAGVLGYEPGSTIKAGNEWTADGGVVLRESLTLSATFARGSNVVDYQYRFDAPTDKPVTIAENPFGGFCYRALPRGRQELSGPEGKPLDLPNSVFNKAETNWPASNWYDLTYHTPDEKVNGVAVMNHPQNPPSTWHVVRNIHMVNPCIAAGGPVVILKAKPLILRYRLVVHDGVASAASLAEHWRAFAASR